MKATTLGANMSQRNQLPTPEFVTATTWYGIAYGWKCEGHGITAMGDSKKEALANWKNAFQRENGKAFVEQGQLFEMA
jgi:hypothetical protein